MYDLFVFGGKGGVQEGRPDEGARGDHVMEDEEAGRDRGGRKGWLAVTDPVAACG